MKNVIITAAGLRSSLRLDGLYHCNEAAAAERMLQAFSGQVCELSELTEKILNGPRFARTYVSSGNTGVPFLSSGDMLRGDFRSIKYLARSQALRMPGLTIWQGWTLIACSGTVGNAVGRAGFVRREMDGWAASQDVMRVVPKPSVDAGYLYAYLSSAIAYSLLIKEMYGSVIQHIEPHQLINLPVPLVDVATSIKIGNLIREAAEARSSALETLTVAEELLYAVTGLTKGQMASESARLGFVVPVSDLANELRIDPDHYAPRSLNAVREVQRRTAASLGSLARIHAPPIFTRIYSSEDRGLRYLSQIDLLALRPQSERYISQTRTPRLNEYIVSEGFVLVLGAGQEAVGTPFYCGPDLDGTVPTSDVLRVVPHDRDLAGYIYTYLASEHGQAQLRRFVYGSSIPRLAPTGLAKLLLPWDAQSRDAAPEINRLVVEAHAKRHRANKCEDEAQQLLQNALRQEAHLG